jgi:hypothetical protein
VMITVVYCCPESIKQKIISKGGGAIKSIEIKEPEKPKRAKPEKPDAKPDKPKPTEPKPKPDDKKKPVVPVYPSGFSKPRPDCPPWPPAPVRPHFPSGSPAPPHFPSGSPAPPHFPPWPLASDEPFVFPIVGYGRIWQGYEGPGRSTTPGPTPWIPTPAYSIRTFGGCSEGPCYEGNGRPVYDSYGGGYGSGSYVSRGDYYSEENPTGCTVM